MRRTTIELPDRVDALLRHEAERRGITISQLAREAIKTHLRARRSLLGAAGAGRSGRTDISQRIKEILASEAVP